MDRIKRDLEYLILNIDEWGDSDGSHRCDETLDKLDEILNIIEGVNVKDMVGCTLAIKRMKRLLRDEEE